ncbi:DUF317 domain-containing protein [Streptomyces sp. NPDC059604]|uniref:DUF317 domain-containing protein n=1 Tax=Streptomyces sp. NPDC059604 TaxID=3346881 RepID=UPI00367BDFF6
MSNARPETPTARFRPDDRVLVSPRHLAGAGIDRIRDAINPLTELFDWTSERLTTGRVLLNSPGHEAFLDFAADRQDGLWWTIAHHEPYWQAEFTRQTPIEAIASVTQALPQMLGDHRHANRIPLTTEYVAPTARRSGWDLKKTASGVTWTSPDGHCAVEHTTDPEHPWRIIHSVYDGFDTHWCANFTRDTPEQLVAQFLAHLSDETPVERRFADVPALALGSAVITPARTSVLGSHTSHAIAQVGRVLATNGRPLVSRSTR